MKIITKRYVKVPKSDWRDDKFGAMFVSLDFCQEVAQWLNQGEEMEEHPTLPEVSRPERLPVGMAFTFDDATRTVTYGDDAAVIVFKGAIQYELLKRCQGRTGVNLRDIWRPIWGEGQPEWQTIRGNANAVNKKMSSAGIPYEIRIDTCFANFEEKL